MNCCLHLLEDKDEDHGWVYQWGGTVWTLIGLAWLALMVSSLQELYKLCVHKQEELYKVGTHAGGVQKQKEYTHKLDSAGQVHQWCGEL